MQPRAQVGMREWVRAIALGIGLFLIYMANGREIGAADTIPALLQSVSILRGDGLAVDRFQHLWPNKLPFMFVRKHDVIVSRYPLGPPVLAVPFTAPQLLVLDRVDPTWEVDPAKAFYWARRMGKLSSAAIGALTGVAIYLALAALEIGTLALPATIIAALGSNLWVTGSQSPWQHGAAAFAIAAALALLLPPPRQRWRLVLAGGACALLAHSRPNVAFFCLLILGWVVHHYRARAVWFLILPVPLGIALLAYNLRYFDSVFGGYSDIMRMVGPATHSVSRYWADNVIEGLLGTLVSPNRGLFVFSPWIPLSLATLGAILPSLRRWPLVWTVLCGLPILFVQLALQSTWWAGWSFGPRYWTDAVPVLAIVLGFALVWARRRSPPFFAALLAAGALAIAVQAIGAFYYPSSYNAGPTDIDHDHARLWSWSDGELARCLREGPHGWE
jgi:hypothetical protein